MSRVSQLRGSQGVSWSWRTAEARVKASVHLTKSQNLRLCMIGDGTSVLSLKTLPGIAYL